MHQKKSQNQEHEDLSGRKHDNCIATPRETHNNITSFNIEIFYDDIN